MGRAKASVATKAPSVGRVRANHQHRLTFLFLDQGSKGTFPRCIVISLHPITSLGCILCFMLRLTVAYAYKCTITFFYIHQVMVNSINHI